jgi:hypothetical protein
MGGVGEWEKWAASARKNVEKLAKTGNGSAKIEKRSGKNAKQAVGA